MPKRMLHPNNKLSCGKSYLPLKMATIAMVNVNNVLAVMVSQFILSPGDKIKDVARELAAGTLLRNRQLA